MYTYAYIYICIHTYIYIYIYINGSGGRPTVEKPSTWGTVYARSH